MPFGEPKFGGEQEKIAIRDQEEERGREKLTAFIKEISERLRADGVPVTEDARIDMAAFDNVYEQDVLEEDMRWLKDREAERYPRLSGGEIDRERLKSDGEKLEMLKTAIFTKGLGQEFIVTRSSRYDDEKGIDNVVLEKETDNIICALDEVADTSGKRYQEKTEKVLNINKEEKGSGGTLKYGFKVEATEAGQKKLVLGKVKNIPLFYLALPKRHLTEGINQLTPSFSESSDYEKKLFSYFTTLLSAQIDFLKLEKHLNPALKKRVDHFEKILGRFKEKR